MGRSGGTRHGTGAGHGGPARGVARRAPKAPSKRADAMAALTAPYVPHVWTPERVAAACEVYAAGSTMGAACSPHDPSGLADAALRDPRIGDQLRAARAAHVERLRAHLEGAIGEPDDDWRAWAWLLERRSVDYAPPKQSQEITGKDGGPLAITAVAITPAQQRAQLERELAELDETDEDVRLLRRGE